MADNYMDAENDYMLGMKYKDIATKYGVSINTVKSWKQRYEWGRNKKGAHTKDKVCTQNKKDAYAGAESGAAEDSNTNDNQMSDKRYLFCLYYVKYRNQVKAYQKAYRCSYENACSNASALMKNRDVQRKIGEIMEDIRQDIKLDIRDLIQQQIDIARADITDFADTSGGMVRVNSGFDGTLVKEIRDTPAGICIKLYDKQKAIDWLAKNIKPDGGDQGGVVIINDVPRG